MALRDDRWRLYVYKPALPEAEMQKQLVADFRHRVFGGSAGNLVAALLVGGLSAADLDEIRRLLDAHGL